MRLEIDEVCDKISNTVELFEEYSPLRIGDIHIERNEEGKIVSVSVVVEGKYNTRR